MKGITEVSEGNIIIGEEGLVPTPDENSKGKFLRSDGTWRLLGHFQNSSVSSRIYYQGLFMRVA